MPSETNLSVERSASDIIRAEGAATILGRTPRGIHRAVREGRIPPGVVWKIGRDMYFSRTKLIAWRDAGGAIESSSELAAA